MLFEFAHEDRNRGVLLADSDVDTLNAGVFLVNDGVDRDRGLAGLTVTDDQLTLATTDRNHGVDGLEARHHRLVNRLAFDYAGGYLFDRRRELCV